MYKITPFEFKYSNHLGVDGKKIFSTQELQFGKNGIVHISGDSGAGKSTFLNLLKGLIPEFIPGELSGHFYFDDVKVNSEAFSSFKNKIVYLFQNPFSQLIHRNLNLEFAFTLENLNSLESEFHLKKRDLSKKFGLDNLWEQNTFNLSNGECQKLVLASLLAMGPEVILLDEPTAFLDPEARAEFYKLINELKQSHLIFLVDHHINEIETIIDEKIWIDITGNLRKVPRDYAGDKELLNFNPEFKLNTDLITLSLKNINFSYSIEKLLFENINGEFHSGEIVIIKGKNGKGKSSLFKVMAKILKSQKGNVEYKINNKVLSKNDIEKRVGFVFQNPENNFFYDFLWQELEGGDQELIKLFFTENELKRSPYLFSEGQKRRISILINILMDKKILFLDEPTFGQDQNNIEKITIILNELRNKNYLLFIVSHNEEFIKNVGTHVLELRDHSLYALK